VLSQAAPEDRNMEDRKMFSVESLQKKQRVFQRKEKTSGQNLFSWLFQSVGDFFLAVARPRWGMAIFLSAIFLCWLCSSKPLLPN
jgi:hypothetical protein